MPRSYQAVSVNAFTKGIITEASPLTFPDAAAIDINNFNLNRDGSINRRLGLADQDSTVSSTSSFDNKSALSNLFEWDGAGGIPDARLLVLQDGTTARIFDRADNDIAANEIGTINLSVATGVRVDFASVDNYLVIATGGEVLIRTSYDGTNITTETFRLSIRDVFGVDDGTNTGQDVTIRPTSENQLHTYNLRNQTWADRRKLGNTESVGDCLENFRSTAGAYPSNADTVNQALFPDPNDGDDRVGNRFFADEVRDNPLGVTAAPKGYFIIDALTRGEDRLARVTKVQSDNGYGSPDLVTALPQDKTPGGAATVAEYAGRAFYGGFSGSVIDGDENSPNLGSYLLFSKLVRAPSDLSQCYSDADPTSAVDPDPVATDGGFVKIEGAYNIISLTVLQDALYVLAENGIWSVSGGDVPFDAQDIVVTKLTDKGITSAASVLTTDQSLYYWSESGIYVIGPNDFGDYHPLNISNTTIQSIYNDIPFDEKTNAVGVYGSYEQKIYWQYSDNSEIVLDLNLQAFYRNTFGSSRNVRASFTIPPYQSEDITENITVNSAQVTVNGEDVTVTTAGRKSNIREVAYVTAIDNNGLTDIKFSTKSGDDFKDYGTDDASAFLATGYAGLSDFQRNKDVPYLTLHFKRTETGLDDNFELLNQSSCLVRVSWDWATSATSNRFSKQFQGYRLRRAYIPVEGVEYDPGFETVVTKNKVRGRGEVLSIQFETEPDRDCNILGWAFIVGAASNV
jgi:hypothetical protein